MLRAPVVLLLVLAGILAPAWAYWMGEIAHQGKAPFASPGYHVFRNVKDYGAKGDGKTDDTAAIQAAMTSGNRCEKGCASTTTTPAVVYFPSGTYLLSKSLLPPYFTQIIGDANDRPILKAKLSFVGFGLIDGNHYYSAELNWISTNVFYRQVRNLVFDTTAIPFRTKVWGMHWPTSQATSLQNLKFVMPTAKGCAHVGLFIENGSAGFLSDLTFIGGAVGASVGNQQYTMRNMTFQNCETAIVQLWDWGWTYTGLHIFGCNVGIDISVDGPTDQKVGSVILIDSTFANVNTAIKSAYSIVSQPPAGGSVILENIVFSNVETGIMSPTGMLLGGGSVLIAAWGQGHSYSPTGPSRFQGTFAQNARPDVLLSNGKYYARSKPQYENLPVSSFISARSSGAKGDGVTDDTRALQSAVQTAAATGKVLYIDYGIYRVTSTIYVPPGSKIVGESYPVIMSSGAYFAKQSSPQVVVRVGTSSGQPGHVELSDFIVSTQGAQAGAVLIQWNLATVGNPSGMWDVHTRVGGFKGSNLQVAQCGKAPKTTSINANCIAAYLAIHITKHATNLYMENNWIWTADHDLDDSSSTQISVYAGRGLLLESQVGTFWLVGTASEHHTLYQYQMFGTKNIFMTQAQTESPYYQPNPPASSPFSPNVAINDPDFNQSCKGQPANCAMAWGMRVQNSTNIFIYGAGFYSFFTNYGQTCVTMGQGSNCQASIISLEGSVRNVRIYNLNTIGTESMLNRDGDSIAKFSDNPNVYPATIALFKSG